MKGHINQSEPTFAPFMFDTHKYIKLLKSKGVKEDQAEMIVQVVSESRETDLSKLATKEQVINLEKRLDKFEIQIKEELKDIREDMKDFRKEIRTMFRWTVGMTITGLVATATMLAFILPLLIKH